MDRVIKLEVVGYQIRRGEETFGAAGSGNAVRLRIFFDAAWDGMVKTAIFTDARGAGGTTTEVELLTRNADGSYDALVPPEAMAYAGKAEMTLEGAKIEGGTVSETLTTRPLSFRVYDSGAWRVAWNTEPITATDKQQIMAKVSVAEAYAKGTVDGVPVEDGETGYHDNAMYYKELARLEASAASSSNAEANLHTEDAEMYAEDAAAAKNEAVEAKSAAETARDTANTAAQTAAAKAGEASESAADAEAAQDAAEEAREKAEEAQAAAESAAQQSAANQYAAFPTETQTEKDVLSTDIGADGAPAKSMKVNISEIGEGVTSIALRRCGKNLFPSNPIVELNEDKNRWGCKFHLPAGEYTFSVRPRGGGPAGASYFSLAIYRQGEQTVTLQLSANDKNPKWTAQQYAIQDDDEIWIYYSLGNATWGEVVNRFATVIFTQIEIGRETTETTVYEEYTYEDYPVALETGEQTVEGVTTRRGANNLFLVTDSDKFPSGKIGTVSATYRLDPTLVYEKLKAAIIAAGN